MLQFDNQSDSITNKITTNNENIAKPLVDVAMDAGDVEAHQMRIEQALGTARDRRIRSVNDDNEHRRHRDIVGTNAMLRCQQ